jgi:hypothetical protein
MERRALAGKPGVVLVPLLPDEVMIEFRTGGMTGSGVAKR